MFVHRCARDCLYELSCGVAGRMGVPGRVGGRGRAGSCVRVGRDGDRPGLHVATHRVHRGAHGGV